MSQYALREANIRKGCPSLNFMRAAGSQARENQVTGRTRDNQATLREAVIPEGAARHGVVIGIEAYGDERLNLRCARADAEASGT